jgi:hypothetical protein
VDASVSIVVSVRVVVSSSSSSSLAKGSPTGSANPFNAVVVAVLVVVDGRDEVDT